MAAYQLTQSNDIVIRNSDGANIPAEMSNRDWVAYQIWLADGNTPDPYVPPPAPAPIINGALFLSRITDAEYTAIITASQTNVPVARWIEILRIKGVVNLGDPIATNAKAGLVAMGLLTQQRADTIFAP